MPELKIKRTLTTAELIHATGFSRSYIQAAKKAGYRYTHGTRRTTEESFWTWLEAHPDFTTTSAYPARPNTGQSRSSSPSGKPGAPSSTHDQPSSCTPPQTPRPAPTD